MIVGSFYVIKHFTKIVVDVNNKPRAANQNIIILKCTSFILRANTATIPSFAATIHIRMNPIKRYD